MNIIVAADRKWAIGKQGGLLVSIPEDMRLFREETLGKVVVMGRKTLESLPGGQPLYGRTTIVLTRNPEYKVKGAIVCHSLEEALEKLKAYPLYRRRPEHLRAVSSLLRYRPCHLYRLFLRGGHMVPGSG